MNQYDSSQPSQDSAGNAMGSSKPYVSYQPSKWAGTGTPDYKKMLDTFRKKIDWYQSELRSLRDSLEDGDCPVEDRRTYLRDRVESLSLTLANDLSTAMQYELDKGVTAYYEKAVGTFKVYLRDVRETLRLFITAEQL